MLNRPTLALFATFLTWLYFCCLVQAADDAPGVPTTHICKPFGVCEPCPEDARDQPFCKPFGNRRLMHCVSTDPEHSDEKPAWESCGRIVSKERADFWEFVACNVAFATIALAVVHTRQKKGQAIQARKLAARIGLNRDSRNRGT